MNDQAIIDLYWNRSEKAIAETKKQYGAYCHSIAMRILQNTSDADECENDVYLRLWNAIPPQRPNHFKAYIGRIARNHALNLYQKRTARKRGADEIPMLLDELSFCVSDHNATEIEDRAAFADLLNRFLEEQSEQARRMFVQRYWYGYQVKEIARAHQVSESSVAAALYRTRKAFARYLQEKGEAI